MENGGEGWITVQKAKFHRNLASSAKMVQAGSRVIFDQKHGVKTSRRVNKKTGDMNHIRYNGIYEIDVWVRDRARYGEYGVLTEDEVDGHDGKKGCRVFTGTHE